MEKFIEVVKYSDLLKEFVSFYLKQYGEVKLKDISQKVHTSNKVQKFISEAKRLKIQLGTDDFLATIHSSTHFTFSKAETIAAASIILLCKWEQEVGKPNNLAEDLYLNKIFFRILNKCDGFKTHISNNRNFFERFYDHLENVLGKEILKQQKAFNKNNPKHWIEVGIESIKFYDPTFNPSNFSWSDKYFAIFIINCAIIYMTKFPDEIHQIGWDYTIEEKNIFIDLILINAKDFNSYAVDTNDNAELFEEKDRVDNSLKDIALCIDRFYRTKEISNLNMIAYNVFDEPIVIDFVHEEHENEEETINFCGQSAQAITYIGNSLI